MSIGFMPRTVVVYDANEQPVGAKAVVRRCQRCARSRHARTARRVFWEVVSPGGTEHLGGARTGVTECGIDATEDGWWWQL